MKVNFYWLYGVLALFFIGLQIMNWGGTTKEIGWGELKPMLENQEVEKLVLVNKEVAKIYIRKDKLALDKFKAVRPTKTIGEPDPQYTYPIGSQEAFEKDVDDAQQNVPDQQKIFIKNRTNGMLHIK